MVVSAALATLAVAGHSNAAKATKPRSLETLQFQAGVRYGVELTSHDYKLWQLGYGGTVGYTLDNSIYLGGSFDLYQGETYNYVAGDPYSPEVGGNYWQALVHVGFDRRLSKHWLWRPKVGVGWATLNVRNCNTLIGNTVECAKTIRSDTALVPGVELVMSWGVLLSLEARYVMLFDSITIKHAVIGAASAGFAF